LSLTGYVFEGLLKDVYVQGGLGVGMASFPTSTVTAGPSRIDVTRPALMAGLGYDIAARCPLWIGPFAQIFNTLGGGRIKLDNSGAFVAHSNAVLFQGGIALRLFHPGPRGSCSRRGA
jgi:hypothetical protein